MTDATQIAETAHALAREGFEHEFGSPKVKAESNPEWRKVRETGTTLWLDTGDIEEATRLWAAEFEALTTNNTLLNMEVQKGIYDDYVKRAAAAFRKVAPDMDAQELALEIAFVLNAHHALRLVERFDAHVSVELHTDLANDTERSVAYGKRYFAICPERFYVKVPLTPAGLLAARRLGEAGVPINFTLGFSARQNYVAALVARPCFVNVFMARLNQVFRENGLGDGVNVGERATLATQREITLLRQAGRTEARLIGASMREARQVRVLAGLDLFTMPIGVTDAYLADPVDKLVSEVNGELPVALPEGASFADVNGDTLWDTPEAFRDCVDDLLKKGLAALTGDDLQAHFEAAGFGDFLPRWSEADWKTHHAEGKIPVLKSWQPRLANGEIGLDALLNAAGLQSFTDDQAALDGRVKSLI